DRVHEEVGIYRGAGLPDPGYGADPRAHQLCCGYSQRVLLAVPADRNLRFRHPPRWGWTGGDRSGPSRGFVVDLPPSAPLAPISGRRSPGPSVALGHDAARTIQRRLSMSETNETY